MSIEGKPAATVTGKELGAGWNMTSAFDSVLGQRAVSLLGLIGKLQGPLNTKWRDASKARWRHLMGFCFKNEIDEFLLLAVAFNIKFGSNDLSDVSHIAIANMTFIGARMNGDAVGAEFLRVDSGFKYVWFISAAAVAQRCKLVDVYGELDHHAKINPEWMPV